VRTTGPVVEQLVQFAHRRVGLPGLQALADLADSLHSRRIWRGRRAGQSTLQQSAGRFGLPVEEFHCGEIGKDLRVLLAAFSGTLEESSLPERIAEAVAEDRL
jgi:hypothetical protein